MGAIGSATTTIPGTQVVTGASIRWSEYYDPWGRIVGRSPATIAPIVSSYKLKYHFTRTKSRVPMVRSDGAAYALFELSDATLNNRLATTEIVVASAAFYWTWRFAEFRRLEARPPFRSSYPVSVYDLDLESRYDNVLFGHILPETAGQVLHTWRLGTMLAAIDTSDVPLERLEFYVDDCGRDVLRKQLMDQIGRARAPARTRRALMLDALGSLDGVASVISLLDRPETEDAAAACLRTIAARHGDAAAAKYGTEPKPWRDWLRTASGKAKPSPK